MNADKKKGLFIPEAGSQARLIHLIRYNEQIIEENELESLSQIPDPENFIHWINIVEPGKDFLKEMSAHFDLHPLTRDYHDVAGRRPALYEFDNHLLLTARTISRENNYIRSELIGMVLGKNYVISLQEHVEDDFDAVRERLRQKIGWIRARGSDHLFYRLLDAISEEYFLVAEHLDERAEELMDELERGGSANIPLKIRDLRESSVEFRRAVAPMRDVLAALIKSESALMTSPVHVFFRDVHQQSLQLMEIGQLLMEKIKDIQGRHHLLISERMNNTIQVLTVITAFFIPLTFLVGVYGMNFEHMPELGWRHGYRAFWILSLIVTVAMFITFKKRKWF